MTPIFQVRVQGQLDPILARWFGDFAITHTPDGDTLLTGVVIDQAALHGVFAHCRDLGLTIVSVNRVHTTFKKGISIMSNWIHVEVSRALNARPEDVYAVIADYRVAHPAILPKQFFTSLTVEQGGKGEGTVVRGSLKVFGQEYGFHQLVTEPEPGRVLVETDIETGQFTRFAFEPVNNGSQTRLTIASDFPPSAGLMGMLERLTKPAVVRNIYNQELDILAEYVQDKQFA